MTFDETVDQILAECFRQLDNILFDYYEIPTRLRTYPAFEPRQDFELPKPDIIEIRYPYYGTGSHSLFYDIFGFHL